MGSARDKLPQLGFWDDEVPKRSHDSMVLWAHANAERLVRQYLAAFPSRDFGAILSKTWGGSSITLRNGEKLSTLPPLPPKPTELVEKKTFEYVLQQHPENGNGRMLPRILGYADLVIFWNDPTVEWGDDQQWHISGRSRRVLIEAKTVLPSIGELMRQINLYRLVCHDVIVVAPDTTYADILREQGVLVVPFDSDGAY